MLIGVLPFANRMNTDAAFVGKRTAIRLLPLAEVSDLLTKRTLLSSDG
jgi:hypothetical protein